MRFFLLILCAGIAAPASAHAQATLDDIEVSTDQVVFMLDRPVKEKVLRLQKPDRIIVELPGTISALAQGVFDGKGRFLAQVRADQAEAAPGAARTVLELKAPASYRTQWEKGRLSVKIYAGVAPKPLAAPKAVGKGFLIQAGAFSKKETAVAFKTELEPAVAGWSVSTTTVRSAVLYRLRAGPFALRAEAEAAVKKLAAMGEKAVILPNP